MRLTSSKISKYSRSLMAQIHEEHKNFKKKAFKPGQHKSNSLPSSEYGKQLREMQILKIHHGISSKQFSNYFKKAKNLKGDKGENLIKLINSRLDINVVRGGLTSTFSSARQLVNHGLILVNGKKVDIASYILQPEDVISVKEKALKIEPVLKAMENKSYQMPEYLKLLDKNKVQFVQAPSLPLCPYNFKIDLNTVIGYFSR